MSTKVIVIGGGVAGMTVAHELACRKGFEVTVYERRDRPGGKARSMPASPGVDGRRDLPGEHGFRFFPGFYRHLPDTLGRIPYGEGTVLDNLVETSETRIVRSGGRAELRFANHLPSLASGPGDLLRFLVGVTTGTGVPLAEQKDFVQRLDWLLQSSEERRYGEWENCTWWDYSGAESHSEAYRKFLADGLTRTLVAARAKEISARTGGYTLIQLLLDFAGRGRPLDRVLTGPTSDVWIDPWLAHLESESLRVKYSLNYEVREVRSEGGRVTGVAGVAREPGKPEREFKDTADYYVAAVPVEVMQGACSPEPPADQPVLDLGDLPEWSPSLERLRHLRTRWMNGVIFYLAKDVPLNRGHTIYIDSEWALTSISQAQFWHGHVEVPELGDGRVRGILSVDVSDWDTPGRYVARGKTAKECTKDEIVREVWAQLQESLNDRGELVLHDADLVGSFVDPDIVFPNPEGATVNLEPLLINTAGSWENRPRAELDEVRNLFLASDYVQTCTDLATMEGANEAGRRAVNAILEASGSTAERCPIWPLEELGGFWEKRREHDVERYHDGKPPYQWVTEPGGEVLVELGDQEP